MLQMLSTMLICESSDLDKDNDAPFEESDGDERMKSSEALSNIFTSADPIDRNLVSIADICLNRDAFKS